MTSSRVGILHPGEMGASIGAAAVSAGAHGVWASTGRSAITHRRAEEAGLADCVSIDAMVEISDLIVSVCPPDAALDLAGEIARAGFSGIFVDANAISPDTARRVGEIVEGSAARFVDGGIIGPPARQAGTTRLYLSGDEALTVAALFSGSLLAAEAMDTRPGAASALKMCYAAYTKGSTALLLAIRALAGAEGVAPSLIREWALSQPGLEVRSESAARNNAFKAWRFAGEMREIASSFEANELPGGFHRAAADIFDRLSEYKDCDGTPDLAEVIAVLLGSHVSPGKGSPG